MRAIYLSSLGILLAASPLLAADLKPTVEDLLRRAKLAQDPLVSSFCVMRVDNTTTEGTYKVRAQSRIERYRDAQGRIRLNLDIRELEKTSNPHPPTGTTRTEYILLDTMNAMYIPGARVQLSKSEKRLAIWRLKSINGTTLPLLRKRAELVH
jgi:hypothetical protein